MITHIRTKQTIVSCWSHYHMMASEEDCLPARSRVLKDRLTDGGIIRKRTEEDCDNWQEYKC